MHRAIAEDGVVEFVTRERDMHPRQGETKCHQRQHAIAEIETKVMPGRSGLSGIDAAPCRAREAMASRPEQRDLQEDEERNEINALNARRQTRAAERQSVGDDVDDAERRED